MGLERIQKIIAATGRTSRRKAESLITAGRVTVNGQVIRILGSKADPEKDHIKVDGKLLRIPRKVYLLLNKPRGCLCAVEDLQGRPTVLELVAPHRDVYPVGRLDFNSEGLLLLTNDGDFAMAISRPGRHCPKTYEVKSRGILPPERVEEMRKGMQLPGVHRLAPVEIEAFRRDAESRNGWYRMKLHEGKKNQIRKMFQVAGHPVVKLRRTGIGFLHETRLAPGQWRELSEGEVRQFLRQYAAAEGQEGAAPAPAGPAKPRRRPAMPRKRPFAKTSRPAAKRSRRPR